VLLSDENLNYKRREEAMTKAEEAMTKAEPVMEGATPQTMEHGCTPQGVITITTSLATATNGTQPQHTATTATSVKPPARD
jgi:hypothetical protein